MKILYFSQPFTELFVSNFAIKKCVHFLIDYLYVFQIQDLQVARIKLLKLKTTIAVKIMKCTIPSAHIITPTLLNICLSNGQLWAKTWHKDLKK